MYEYISREVVINSANLNDPICVSMGHYEPLLPEEGRVRSLYLKTIYSIKCKNKWKEVEECKPFQTWRVVSWHTLVLWICGELTALHRKLRDLSLQDSIRFQISLNQLMANLPIILITEKSSGFIRQSIIKWLDFSSFGTKPIISGKCKLNTK